jgi:hypothetical protein
MAKRNQTTDEELAIETPSPPVDPNRHGYAIVGMLRRQIRKRPTDRPIVAGIYLDNETPPVVEDEDVLVDDSLMGYVIAKNGHITGTMMEFRPRAHISLVNAFRDYEEASAMVDEIVARDIADATRPQAPRIRIADLKIPVADVEKRQGGKLNANLDATEIQILDGIVAACRHNNVWLPNKQPIDSRADAIRWLIERLRAGVTP